MSASPTISEGWPTPPPAPRSGALAAARRALRSPRLHRLVAALGLVAAIAWAARAATSQSIALDDAFISFRYADNLAHGRGLVYNPGERVEGYTNFLWTIVSAAVIRLGYQPLPAMRGFGIAAYLGMVAAAGLLLAHLSRRSLVRLVVLLPLLALLVLPDGLAAFAGCGLETPLFAALILGVGLTEHVFRPRGRLLRASSAALPLLLCLTRLDGAIFVAASAAATFLDGWVRERRLAPALRAVAARMLPTAIGLGAYVGWKLVYYRSLLPNSYYAKAADAASWEAGARYLLTYLQSSPHAVALLPLALLAVFGSWRTPLRSFAVFAGLGVAGFILYVAKVGGDFMHYRFVFEVYPLFLCLAAVGLGALAERRLTAAAACVALALPLALGKPILETSFGMQSLAEMNDFVRVGKQIGERMRARLPPTTRIATTLAGTMSFYSQLFTLDQWGLNDSHVAHLPSPRVYSRGHVKAAPEGYVRSRGVNLWIWHPVVCSCSRPCVESKPNVFIRLDGDQCLRSWYIHQTPALTRHLCAHPEWFLLHDVACPPI